MQTVYVSKGKELLKLLINNGFEGYFVGEVVRNTIMNVDFKRADIITNAKIDDLRRINNFIFGDSATLLEDNILKVTYSDYDYYFKSFSSAVNDLGDNRSKLTKHYSSNLIDELGTRDFTISAIAMSYNGKITDAFSGANDIKLKKIRTITNPKTRFNNYPLDILEAIRLAGELRFSISDKTYQGMVKKAKLLNGVNKEKIYNYLEEIINTRYSRKALGYLLSGGIYKNIPSLSKGIKIAYRNAKTIEIEDLLLASFVLNGEIDRDYLAYVKDARLFNAIFDVAVNNKKALYEPMTLFLYGEDVCIKANYINYLVGRDHIRAKAIKKEYGELKVKSYDELAYKKEEIETITSLGRDSDITNEIFKNVVLNILNETLENNYDDILRFVLKELTTKGIYFDLDQKEEERVLRSDDEVITQTVNADYSPKSILSEDEEQLKESIPEEDDYTSHRLRILEERLDEQDRLIQEKNEILKELENQKVLETTSKLVNASLEQIKRDSQLASMIKNVDEFELEYRNFIVDFLEKDNRKDE